MNGVALVKVVGGYTLHVRYFPHKHFHVSSTFVFSYKEIAGRKVAEKKTLSG